MRIAWLSNAPWAPTGYGNQTKVFTPRINATHPTALLSFYGLEGGELNWQGMPVYPKGYHPYGQDIAVAHARDFRADILISLMDAWVCDPAALKGMPWCPWFPVDMEPLPEPVRKAVATAFQPIVFSRFGQRMAEAAGLQAEYVPHGVDVKALAPMSRFTSREKLGLPRDAFIVGMVAANKGNPSRKAFWQQMEAFRQLKARHNDALLYLHTTKGQMGEMGGLNLPELALHLGLEPGKDVIFSGGYRLASGGYNDDFMSMLYSAFDVFSNVALGEGFGVPILEAQACGTPVVVGDWTAMSELCFSGWLVPREGAQRTWWSGMQAWQFDPFPAAIAEQYEAAYLATDRNDRGHFAMSTARRDYDADYITATHWLPVLQRIQEALTETKSGFEAALREAVAA